EAGPRATSAWPGSVPKGLAGRPVQKRGQAPFLQGATRRPGGTGRRAALGRALAVGALAAVLARARLATHDLLAGPVRVLRRRIGDHVDGVEQRDVVAVAARDVIGLAVAGVEAVVPRAAVQRVGGRVDLAVRAGVDVATGQRPEVVVPVAAERRVDA